MFQVPLNITIDSAAIKSWFSNLTSDQISLINNIYQLRLRDSWLRTVGGLNLFLGLITLWLGSPVLYNFSIVRLIQYLIGAVIIVQSIWALVSQNTAGLLRFSGVFLISGVWNVFLAINGGLRGGPLLVGIFGLLQLKWAYDTFLEYRRYQALKLPEPSPETKKIYDDIGRAVKNIERKNDPDVIQIWIGQLWWRALLLENVAIFVLGRRNLVAIEPKDLFNFIPHTLNPTKKRRIYGSMNLNAVNIRAMMPNRYFSKYAAWKGQDLLISQAVPSSWERLPRAVRVMILIILGLVGLFFSSVLLGSILMLIQYR